MCRYRDNARLCKQNLRNTDWGDDEGGESLKIETAYMIVSSLFRPHSSAHLDQEVPHSPHDRY